MPSNVRNDRIRISLSTHIHTDSPVNTKIKELKFTGELDIQSVSKYHSTVTYSY